jgi:predicted O-methyltransferase YrrM
VKIAKKITHNAELSMPSNVYARGLAPLKPGYLLAALSMRNMRHRTPQYVYHRTRLMWYEVTHPGSPCLSPDAIRLLPSMLRSSDQGVEFGSGVSTAWFAARVGHLTSVESDKRWYATVSAMLKERRLTNAQLVLAPRDQPAELGDRSEYARTAFNFPDESIDFALIDGIYRGHTARLMMPKIKLGGFLIIDDAHWFLPSDSRSPNARTYAMGADGPVWEQVAAGLSGWRTIWTSSGVNDTAIYVKPQP